MGGNALIGANGLEMKKPTGTRLGSAVRAAFNLCSETSPMGKEKHSTNHFLRDMILGAQDGLVEMLGITLGVVAASWRTAL
jgi:hypothetical protein